MPYASQPRSPAALATTIAVHVGLGAAALLGISVAVPPAVPPMVTTNYREPVHQPPPAQPPRTREQKIAIDIVEPVFTIAQAPDAERPVTAGPIALDPGAGSGSGGTAIDTGTDKAVQPLGPTTSAVIDERFRKAFQPAYPPASQRIGEAGIVVVRVVIGTDGHVLRASVARSSGFRRLDEAAVARALSHWRFVPALKDGVAVEAERELPVTFRLVQR